MSTAGQTDATVQYLEDKLSLLARGPSSDASRNAALDILTGRTRLPDLAEVDVVEPSVYQRRAVEPAAGKTRWPWMLVAIVAAAALLAFGFVRQTPAQNVAQVVAEIAVEPEPVEAPTTIAATPEPPMPTVTLPQPSVTLRVLLDDRSAHRLWARTPSRFVAVGVPGVPDELGDAVLSATFHKTGGPSGGGYGLIVRASQASVLDGDSQTGRYYVFEVGDRGQVGVWLRDEDHWVDLLSWAASDAVRPGVGSNELTVTATGDQLAFLVNGVPVASQVDALLHKGKPGIFVGGDGNQVTLERVTVRVPS